MKSKIYNIDIDGQRVSYALPTKGAKLVRYVANQPMRKKPKDIESRIASALFEVVGNQADLEEVDETQETLVFEQAAEFFHNQLIT